MQYSRSVQLPTADLASLPTALLLTGAFTVFYVGLCREQKGSSVRQAIIAYDISDNKRRYRVHRLLKQYGLPTQYSVFACALDTDTARVLFQHLQQLIDPTADSVLLAWLDAARKTRSITVPPTGYDPNAALYYAS